MEITITFFGRLKQDVGVKKKTLALAEDSLTVGELVARLIQEHPALAAQASVLAYAVNDTLVARDHVLRDGDQAALLPPVSGG